MTDSTLRPKTAPRNDLTAEAVRALLDYDPATGVLTWRRREPRTREDKIFNGQFAGKRAGARMQNGYTIVCISPGKYLAHRLAWLITHGDWPDADIDHINGDRGDNRLANLREASRSQNNANMGLRADNRSGVRGVFWDTRSQMWRAEIMMNNKVTPLGRYSDIKEATEVRRSAEMRMFGEFRKSG